MKKTKKKRTALRMLLFTVISVVFGFCIYTWNAQSLTGNAMPTPFGVGVGVVMSGSMEPELSVDDLIVVKERKTYEIGDVVVYQQRNSLVVHKIIAIDGEVVVTQGTANDTPDEPIPMSAIKGEVVFHVGKIGGVVNWLKTPFGTTLILGLAVLFLIKSYSGDKEEKAKSEELERIKREIEKLKAEQEKKDGE